MSICINGDQIELECDNEGCVSCAICPLTYGIYDHFIRGNLASGWVIIELDVNSPKKYFCNYCVIDSKKIYDSKEKREFKYKK